MNRLEKRWISFKRNIQEIVIIKEVMLRKPWNYRMLVTKMTFLVLSFTKIVAENIRNIRSSSDNPFTTLKFAKVFEYREFNAKGNSIILLI